MNAIFSQVHKIIPCFSYDCISTRKGEKKLEVKKRKEKVETDVLYVSIESLSLSLCDKCGLEEFKVRYVYIAYKLIEGLMLFPASEHVNRVLTVVYRRIVKCVSRTLRKSETQWT